MGIEIQIISRSVPRTTCISKIIFPSSKHTLTNQDELALLRQCANSIKDHPQRSLKIIARGYQQKIAFIYKTLIHLGVSCGQIITRAK